MILFFKNSWVRWFAGVAILSAALLFVHDFRGLVPPLARHYYIPPVGEWGTVLKWVAIGLGLELGILSVIVLVGTIALPKNFLRWILKEPARLYANGTFLSALAGGLMAALLEEPLFRLELQPELVREASRNEGYLMVALIFAACHWTPSTNLLAFWAFPRSLILTYIHQAGGIGWIPMLAHGIGDILYLSLFAWLGKQGLTHERPEKPKVIGRGTGT